MADSSFDIFEQEPKANCAHVSKVFYSCKDLHHPSGELGDAISFDSIEHGEIKVDFPSGDTLPAGNYCTTIPNIEVFSLREDGCVLRLTWEEARKLCAALWQVTNIAEFG
jgi:hypothetical protein